MGIISNINFKLLPMKAHYFLYNAGTGCVRPYMPVFARQLGFSTFVVGTIYSILPILGLISKPLFGALADRYQRHKSMFVFFILLTVTSFSTVQFIPPIPKSTQINVDCNDGFTILKFCPSKLDHCAADSFMKNVDRNISKEYTFDLKCAVNDDKMWDTICKEWRNNTNCERSKDNLIHIMSYVKHEKIEKPKDCLFFIPHNTTYTNPLIEHLNAEAKPVICARNPKYSDFHSFSLKFTGKVDNEEVMDLIVEPSINDKNATHYSQFWYLFIALCFSWVGMAVVVSVGDAICFDLLGKRHELYGHQRVWGSVGWGIFSLLAGYLVDVTSGGKAFKNYSVIYYLMVVALMPNTLVSSCLEFKPNKFSSNIIKDVGKLFKSAIVVVFFQWCVPVGICTALVWNFLFWHLEDLADKKGDCSNQESIKTLQGLVQSFQTFGGELPFFFISGWFINKVGHVNSMTLVLLTLGIRLTLYSVLTNPWWVLPIDLTQGMTSGIFYTAMAMYAHVVAPSGTAATLQGLVGAVFDIYSGSVTFRIFGFTAICLSFVHFFVQKFLDTFAARHDYRTAAAIPNDDFQMLEDDNDYF